MMSGIEVRTEFEDTDQCVEIPEDTTLAELSIYVGDECITRNRPRQRTRLAQPSESVFGPVAGLADWFIENWMAILWETHTPFKKGDLDNNATQKAAVPGVREATAHWSDYLKDGEDDLDGGAQESAQDYSTDRERYVKAQARDNAALVQLAEWQHRHLLGHASSSLALPSVVILPEGRDIVLSVDRLPGVLGASVDFLGPDKQPRTPTLFVVGHTAFKEEAQAFVDRTIEHARSSQEYSEWAEWLRERWLATQAEESDPKQQLRCMLGAVSASRVEELLSQNRRPVAKGLEHLLLDCPVVNQKSELRPAEVIVDEYVAKSDSSLSSNDVAGWEEVGQATISPHEPDFDQGYKLARVVRSRMGLGSRPIRDLDSVLNRLDVTLHEPHETALFRAAVCAPRERRAHIIPSSNAPRMDSLPAFRFAVISALGRLLWESRIRRNEPICAAQGDHAMISKGRRANAFAAEFLLPSEAIGGLGPDNPELWDRVDAYGISHSAARWHAHNVAARLSGGSA